ncbi:MAG: right-handed parallel beta-helix repeat-containing protein [Gammaproteobacteria bacterium]|nr:right-handed parallel beta-helix repeat-containing protein [Gammaproteobacteria bacterium]
MSTIDLSREATNFAKHYSSVRMQQGRVLDDQTVNEQARIIEEDMRRTRLNTIGAYGSPDAGFSLTDFVLIDGNPTFTINQGSLYLGGLHLQLEQDQALHLQHDWLNFSSSEDGPSVPAEGESRIDMVYLDAWQQPVSAVEDSELFEVALAGADTSQRMKTMQRVRVYEGVSADECHEAWQELQAAWAPFGTIAPDMELASQAKLRVSYSAPTVAADLCSLGESGGYLHHENQAIRVQMTSATHFTWGFDNAAPLYRAIIETEEGQRVRLRLLNEPKDAVHWPLQGQAVEILPWSAVLPNGERTADISGMMAKVARTYSPLDASFTVDTVIADDYGMEWESRSDKDDFFDGTADQRFVYVRVWNRGDDVTSAAEIPIAENTLGNTGLTVDFIDGPLRKDLFWIIAARTASPNLVIPWELEAVDGAAYYGYQHYRAPLALVRWRTIGGITSGELIHDCRVPFLPLTRIKSCCEYSVGDGTHSHGQFTSIQAAITALPPSGGKICVLPGEYQESIVIDRHHVMIHGCGEKTRIVAEPGRAVVEIQDAHDIHLEQLMLIADEAHLGIHVSAEQQIPHFLTFNQLSIFAAQFSALLIEDAAHVTITNNRFVMEDRPSDYHGVFVTATDVLIEHNKFLVRGRKEALSSATSLARSSEFAHAARGGLHIGGGSEQVRIVDNFIQGGIGNGITLGSVEVISDDNQRHPFGPGWIVGLGDPCDPCAPGSVYFPPRSDDDEDVERYQSRGSLYRISIERNRIINMGLNGVGVIAFFNLAATDEFISVDDCSILGNHIENCLLRDLAATPDEMLNSMGYGAIALADVENLEIVNNHLLNNGRNHLEPICGVYVLHAEGVDISNNRILNNGAKTTQDANEANPGARAGIWIEFATAPKRFVASRDQMYPRQNGVPAVKVHNNIVTQPLGRSLSINALGPVSVVANQLTSQGFVFNSQAPSFLVSNVKIFNLGISNELYLQQLLYSGNQLDDVPVTQPADPDYFVISQPGLDSQKMFGYLGNGNVLFNDNQVMLDLTDQTGFKLGIMAIGIFTLDDLSFQNNQCDISFDFVLDEIFLAQSFLFGWTVRATNNRFKESMLGALFSGLTMGLFGNVTAHNQATHCLRAYNLVPSNLTAGPNHILFDIFNSCESDNGFLPNRTHGQVITPTAGQGQSVLHLLS